MKSFFAIGCMLYTIFGFGFHATESNAFDPFWMRFLVSSIGFTVVILSQISQFFKRNFLMSLFLTMLVYNAHFYFLLYMNDFHPNYKLSLLVVMITTILFINNPKSYLWYSILNLCTYEFVLLMSDNFDKDAMLLGMMILLVLIFGYLKNREIEYAFERLKKREEQINDVNNNVYYGIFRIDMESRLLYANEQLVKMLGYSISEDRMVISELRSVLQSSSEISRMMQNNQAIHDYEVQLQRRDGSDFWGQLSLRPVYNDKHKLECYDGTLIDITSRKKAETELMLFSAAIDHTSTGVIITDKNGGISYCNPYFMKLTGYAAKEMMGKRLEDFGVKDDNSNLHMWTKLVSGLVWKGDLNFYTKAGQIITELTSVAPIRNDKGQIMNFVIVTEDITDRKKAELELLHAKEQAETTTKAKQQFLSTMSHELRTPMNSVIGITNLLLEENPRPEQIENLNILKYSATQLLGTINDILDLSKIEAGKLELHEDNFDLHYLLINTKRTHSINAKKKNLSLSLKVDEILPNILRGDQLRLSQILNNLVGNAVKFTEKGEVKIQVNTKRESLEDVNLQIKISDTGIGISKEQMERIFDSFSQASSDTSRKYGGTGLGLAITKKLVEMMGGTIALESQIGRGSTFTIDLTLKKGSKAFKAEKVAEVGEFSQLHGIKILLVDDNKINQKVASKFLSKWNTIVELADSGQEALEKLKNNSFDIILMDIQMPEMNGYEATQAIRKLADKEKSNIPVIALTAAALSEEKEAAFQSGMNDYVSKPFAPAELYSKLAKYTSPNFGSTKETIKLS
ncbi:MAG: PAS domain S-box protein [Chitinophagales bacterium]|nr:PAS domain S-box protein [Chitinophagales bacterium]